MNPLELFKDRSKIIRICQYCDSAELPKGGVINFSKDSLDKLEETHKLSHGILSLDCRMEPHHEIVEMLRDADKAHKILEIEAKLFEDYSTGSESSGNKNYLTCKYVNAISPQDDDLPLGRIVNLS